MLRRELIDTINGGTAWAFVGSGVSADAGLPTWRPLIERTLASFDSDVRGSIESDPRFERAWNTDQYEACFSAIERRVGRPKLEATVSGLVRHVSGTPAIASILASWPFAAYATSNYDSVLEKVVRDQAGSWVSVGNSDEEIRKVSRDATGVIWHPHGSVNLTDDKSHLVLTVQDYDSIYVETSRLHRQLAGLLTHKRFVFIGFSFKDPEFVRLLKLVSLHADPTRPIIAFLSEAPNDLARRLAGC